MHSKAFFLYFHSRNWTHLHIVLHKLLNTKSETTKSLCDDQFKRHSEFSKEIVKKSTHGRSVAILGGSSDSCEKCLRTGDG